MIFSFRRGTLGLNESCAYISPDSFARGRKWEMTNDAPEQQSGSSGDFVSRIETELLRTRKVLIFGDIHD